MQNRVFFPQSALDQWMLDGTVDLEGLRLTILAEARHYTLAEAVRVVAEVSGTDDVHELVGRVKAKPFLEELGSEIVENSMIIGDNAYDIVPGWVGLPSSTFEEHLISPERATALARRSDFPLEDPTSEEELLVQNLLKTA
jgi:hypothetical protein